MRLAGKMPPPPGLTGHDLEPIEHVVCASPDDIRQFGRPKDPQQLREHNCLTNMYSGPKEWPFKAAARPHLVEVKGTLSSNSAAVLVQMAINGCGIIRVPRFAVREQLRHSMLEKLLPR